MLIILQSVVTVRYVVPQYAVLIVIVGGVRQLEKSKMGAAGQIGGLLSKCSERAPFPRFSPFFFVVSEKDEATLVDWWLVAGGERGLV